jgi:hypothetical protein
LCIFASLTEAHLERTLKQRIEWKKKQGEVLPSGSKNVDKNDIGDPDKHPLATLNRELFKMKLSELDQ